MGTWTAAVACVCLRDGAVVLRQVGMPRETRQLLPLYRNTRRIHVPERKEDHRRGSSYSIHVVTGLRERSLIMEIPVVAPLSSPCAPLCAYQMSIAL